MIQLAGGNHRPRSTLSRRRPCKSRHSTGPPPGRVWSTLPGRTVGVPSASTGACAGEWTPACGQIWIGPSWTAIDDSLVEVRSGDQLPDALPEELRLLSQALGAAVACSNATALRLTVLEVILSANCRMPSWLIRCTRGRSLFAAGGRVLRTLWVCASSSAQSTMRMPSGVELTVASYQTSLRRPVRVTTGSGRTPRRTSGRARP